MSHTKLMTILAVILMLIVAFGVIGCDKPTESKNEPPTCEVISPLNNAKIQPGAIVTIYVEAEDEDGDIKEVRFYINGIGVSSTSSFPYTYEWDTSEKTAGNYMIKVIAKDDDNDTAEDEITVTILESAGALTVTTSNVSNIRATSATCGGHVTSTGVLPVTARGVCWSIFPNPTILNNHTTDGSGTGSFTSSLTGLSPNTTYYVRAYATTDQDTLYGDNESFTIYDHGVMIFVEGGTFQMGSNDGDSDEKPIHTVTLNDFYMDKYEVTQKLYQDVMGTNPSYWKGDSLPVEMVSWYDAVEFCNALSQKEGLTPAYTISGTSVTWNQNANGYRLPTEAEWEYAAGGGASNRTKWAGTNSESNLGNYAWYLDNSYNLGSDHPNYGTNEVGTKQPNSLSLYDMSGNVWEWCWDWFGDYSSSSQTNPTGPLSGSDRVLRGGCWYYDATVCRVACRYDFLPSSRNLILGFRLIRNAE